MSRLYSHVKFIPGIPSYKNVNSESSALVYDFTQANHLPTKPLVCLFGWLGADWKNVAKYSEWYSQCNMNCLTMIPPFTSILSRSVAQRHANAFVSQIEAHVSSSTLLDTPIVFHAMSGNGLNMYGNVIQHDMFKDEQIRRNVKLLIADSTPPVITPERFANGIVGTLNPTLHSMTYPVVRQLMKLYLESPGHKKKEIEDFMQQVVQHQPSSCAKLFIYSDADKVVPPGDVEHFIHLLENKREEQAALGERIGVIEKLHLSDSEHVAHMRRYKFLYTSTILNLLSQICQA